MKIPALFKSLLVCTLAFGTTFIGANAITNRPSEDAQEITTIVAELDPFARPTGVTEHLPETVTTEESSTVTEESSAAESKAAKTYTSGASTGISFTVTPKTESELNPPTRYYVISDFEHAMLGVCPQDVPAGVWGDPLRPIVSLGYRPEERFAQNTPERDVAVTWSDFKRGDSVIANGGVFTYGGIIGGNDCDTKNIAFTMDYSGLTVSWTYPNATPAAVNWANTMAQRMTDYLRSINSQFKAKCGY